MIVDKYKRQLHAFVAGMLALLVYVIVYVRTVGDPATWSRFDRCDTVLGALFCVLAGSLVVLFKILTIGLPAAIAISAIYLKIVKFSTASALLLPLLANIAVGVLVLLALQVADVSPSLWIIAGLVPLTYVILSFARKRAHH